MDSFPCSFVSISMFQLWIIFGNALTFLWRFSMLYMSLMGKSMDWFKVTITGKPHISWQKPMLSCSALPIQWQQGNALWSHISWSASVKQPMDCSFSGKLCTLSEPILGTPNLQGENHLQIDGCWFTWNMKVSTMATSSFSLNHNNAKLGCPS